MERVMRCKFQLNGCEKVTINSKTMTRDNGSIAYIPDQVGVKVRFGAVYEGQHQAETENAVFGKATPYGTFEATIHNPEVAKALEELYGREFYLDFTLCPLADKQQS